MRGVWLKDVLGAVVLAVDDAVGYVDHVIILSPCSGIIFAQSLM